MKFFFVALAALLSLHASDSRAASPARELNCESFGLPFLDATVSLGRDEWQTSSDQGYELSLRSQPAPEGRTTIAVSVATSSQNIFSTVITVAAGDSEKSLFLENLGDFFLSCRLR